MIIKIAEHSGFCFGVKQAIETAENVISEHAAHPGRSGVYSFGPLIHNQSVNDDLTAKGLIITDDLDEIPEGSTVIVRSHGEPEAFYEAAEARGLKIVDATCPFVAKIHKLVSDASRAGKNIIIAGDRTHPEVKGINGWCGGNAFICENAEDAEHFGGDSAFIVCQTTSKKETLDSIINVLSEKGISLEINNTICSATTERQKAAAELASESDCMVVVGGYTSSNSRKLAEICRNVCPATYFIEDFKELPLQEVCKYCKIGVAAGASTPEREIKEVVTAMSDTKEVTSMEDVMEDVEASLRLPRSGDIVKGKIDQVDDNQVIVNLGCKKDGILYPNEVSLEEGQKLTDLFKVGDEIEAKVIKTDDNDGGLLLSKKKLEISEHWNEIKEALENKSTIDVKVSRVVKGGVVAFYKEASGFIPLSQLSNRFVESADEFLGQVLSVKVTRVDERRGNRAVFSHRAVLSEERQQKVDEIWETLNEGDIVEGTVMRFTEYGAFIDLGGIDGLLHISEISWGKLRHPSEVLKIGQKVNVKILSMNKEKGKISLGLKQTTPEPWSIIDEKFHVDDIVKGKVVQLKEYGAFIELEPGLDGLVHISEVANKRVNNISEELTVGQEVTAKILDIDSERKRISLSLKDVAGAEDAEEAPEEEAAPVEEAPAEEAPAEEAPVEEAPVEEAPAEEAAPEEEVPAEEAAPEETPAE
ncbi:MAG: bifunctional 4-hydroxy-3-methylbut-2-enyl diphosphate reductase/30S ribosomal protein S1 [Eubacterium sp.]|nr:bifunctional 4-hydroxy-3-methylbut-2-enyl diphosphate reductase/30S ribosomal protein S1 [Eubacterium sp.]